MLCVPTQITKLSVVAKLASLEMEAHVLVRIQYMSISIILKIKIHQGRYHFV